MESNRTPEKRWRQGDVPLQGSVSHGYLRSMVPQEPGINIKRQPLAGIADQSDFDGHVYLTDRLPEQAPESAPQRFNSANINQYSLASSAEQQSNIGFPGNHGQHIVGVIGCEVSQFTGNILKVFPPSNLNNWNIHPGDRVLGYANHRFISGRDMVRVGCMGPPGSLMELTILHDGRPISLQCPRIDSRLVVGFDRLLGSRHYEQCASQSRFW